VAHCQVHLVRLIWFNPFLNSFTPRLEQTTSSAHNFSKSKVWMRKYLKKSYSYYQCEQCFFKSYYQCEQCFFKYFPKYFVSFSRRRCQNSKMATLGLNELTVHACLASSFFSAVLCENDYF
jgi:hypothetical protein